MRYSQELRDHILKRVLPPQSDSIERVAREEGISEQTIRNWKAQAISENYAPSGNDEPEKWSSQDKFLIVLETSGMSETDLAEYARQKGLYVEQIAEWRDACIHANGGKIGGDLEGNRRRLTSAQNRREIIKLVGQTREAHLSGLPERPGKRDVLLPVHDHGRFQQKNSRLGSVA